MNQKRNAFLAALLFCVFSLHAQEKDTTRGKLPVKRVVLFKNGVGYFEHVGTVHGNESVAITFTSGQLNDVLKSLTVLDLDGGHIADIAYGSAAPVDRQLGDLRLPIGEKATLAEFLGALRGTRLEVKNGSSVIAGRLLSVERKTRISGGTTLEVDYLSLISDNGELRTTEISPGFSVRLLEPGLVGKVDRFLDIVSAGREADERHMVISAAGTGDRSLYVSYISEVPVWKSTYRIVLSSKPDQKPLLQGWAIIDNVVGEDWTNVELSLVAGAPQSFIQNLSKPYYAQRPTIPLPDNVSTTPQTHEGTLIPGRAQLTGVVTDISGATVAGAMVKAFTANGDAVGQASTGTDGIYELESLPDGPVRIQVESPGFNRAEVGGIVITPGGSARQNVQLQVGSASESVTITASAPTLNAEMSATAGSANGGRGRALGSGSALGAGRRSAKSLEVGAGGGIGGGTLSVNTARAQAEAAARSQALGDLFEYKLKDPITILKNRSALVPIAQAPITVEKVSIWNEQMGLPRPQRALWLTNSTGLTLDSGSVSVLEDNTFVGEGISDPIRAGEKRLLSYATDLAVNASSRIGSEQQRVTRVRVSRGMMTQESEIREKKTYTFRNEDSSARTIIVEHPVRSGYELRSVPRPSGTTADWMRFRLAVGPKETASLIVDEARPTFANFALTNISSEQLVLFVNQRSIDATIESALREVLAQANAIAGLESQKENRDTETQKIFDDQQRLRENIKAMKGTTEEKALLQRYTQQLNEQETRLQTLQKEGDELDVQIDAAKAKRDEMIQRLTFDVKL